MYPNNTSTMTHGGRQNTSEKDECYSLLEKGFVKYHRLCPERAIITESRLR